MLINSTIFFIGSHQPVFYFEVLSFSRFVVYNKTMKYFMAVKIVHVHV